MGGALAMTAVVFAVAAGTHAESLEPRWYTNTVVGLNCVIAGYGYAEGAMAFDPSFPLIDAQLCTHTEVVGQVRSLGVSGNSAKFDVVLPCTSFSAIALVADQARRRARADVRSGVIPACQSPPPHRYCQAMPSRSKLLPVRAATPLLA
jgi:hypothetical protein